jgi:hypothetical protein
VLLLVRLVDNKAIEEGSAGSAVVAKQVSAGSAAVAQPAQQLRSMGSAPGEGSAAPGDRLLARSC